MIRILEYHSKNLNSPVRLTYDCGLLSAVNIDTPCAVDGHTVKFINTLDSFIATCKQHNVPYTEILDDIPFDKFWEDFDYKVDKAEAEKVWTKMSMADRVQAHRYIGKHKAWVFKNNGLGKKYPKSYLRQKPWIQ